MHIPYRAYTVKLIQIYYSVFINDYVLLHCKFVNVFMIISMLIFLYYIIKHNS